MTLTIILTCWLAMGFLSMAFLSKLFTHNRAMHEAQRRLP